VLSAILFYLLCFIEVIQVPRNYDSGSCLFDSVYSLLDILHFFLKEIRIFCFLYLFVMLTFNDAVSGPVMV
jgi:hypothetical protein